MRILLLHASLGHREKRTKATAACVADALLAWERANGVGAADPARSGRVEVHTLDALEFLPGFVQHTAPLWAAAASTGRWSRLAQRSAAALMWPAGGRFARRVWNRVTGQRLVKAVHKLQPDVCLCTDSLSLAILVDAKRRGLVGAPVAGLVPYDVVSDDWVEPHVDHMFVASPEAALGLTRRGVPADRVSVTGVPVSASFSEAPAREEARRRLDVDPGRQVALIMGGEQGLRALPELVRSCGRALGPALEQFVVCDDDAALQRRVRGALDATGSVGTVLHETEVLPLLMAAADVVVARPGATATTEALAVGRPLLLVCEESGAEEASARHHVRTGTALEARPQDAAETLQRMLSDQGLYMGLAARAQAHGRPDAAAAVAEGLIGLAPVRSFLSCTSRAA